MRVHSVKHGRYDACRVSVSALFVMTSFFSCSVSLRKIKGGKRSASLLIITIGRM